jgi:hypothetical protein
MATTRPKVVLNASRDIPFNKLMWPVSAERAPAILAELLAQRPLAGATRTAA